MQKEPSKGFKGLVENWQSDFLAAISVAMVALPLSIGIALASGVPPMSGILSVVIGGVVTTFFRSSYVTINGPGAGLIAVILSTIKALDDGTDNVFGYVLAAILVSGVFQVLFGLLKLGRFADIFHSSIIKGILAAIGIIIIANQLHITMGIQNPSLDAIQSIIYDIKHIPDINPFVFIISIFGLLLLIFHSKISYKVFHVLPAPVWLMTFSIPFVYFFNFFEPHELQFLNRDYYVGPELLVNIPSNLLSSIMLPNFAKINTYAFWSSAISITMISSIVTLASSKAVDKLDPYKRKTDLNKELIGVGMSTIVSGFLGGLPIITVIVRSTVNVHNHAKTKWSNLYHGLLIVVFIFLLTPFILQVPLSALAILLVFTGYKLASPKVFKQSFEQGLEQLVFVVSTIIITLKTDLLMGIFGGIGTTLLIHMLVAKVPLKTFFKMMYDSGTELKSDGENTFVLNVKGIANFLTSIKYDKLLKQIPKGTKVFIDFSQARLVDYSILEETYEFQRLHNLEGGKVMVHGFDKHVSSSSHKLSLKLLTSNNHQLTKRELKIKEIADENGWSYKYEPVGSVMFYETFYFFKSRPIAKKLNSIFSQDQNIKWEIADITFEEGAFMASEEYNTTVGLIKLPFSIPKFTIEKKGILDKYLNISHRDIDYKIYDNFSNDFIVKVENKAEMDDFFHDELKAMIQNSDINHIESNGNAILVFNEHLRIVQISKYFNLIAFMEELRKILVKTN